MNTRIQDLPKVKRINMQSLPALAKQQIPGAKLPKLYAAARTALRACVRVDECKDIADKHTAIAHYAKQIKDDSLRFHAQRIYLRALARIGELLEQIPEGPERRKHAKEHGLTNYEANRATKISWLPKNARDKIIETTPPPSQNKMIELGTKAKYPDQGGMRGLSYAEKSLDPTETTKWLCEALYRTIASNAPKIIEFDPNGHLPDTSPWASKIDFDESCAIRVKIQSIIKWLQSFDSALDNMQREHME